MNKRGEKGEYLKGNIPTNKIILPKDKLTELSKEYGCIIIARHFKVSKQTVLRNMGKYEIEKRGVPKTLPEYWKKALQKPKSVPAWSKGLTKETNKSIKQISDNTKGKDNHRWKTELHTGEKVECSCGCGELIDKYDKKGRKRYYARGHCKENQFKSGFIPWNIGKSMPADSIKRGEGASGYKDGRCLIPNFCIDCGKEISYASIRCVGCAHKRELNSAWLGGKSFEKYGEDFTEELKEIIRKRDTYTCQECGFTQEELGYTLSIHHIDYNKKNNNPNNLISLCRSCHQQTNFGREDWADYFQSKIMGVG